MTKQFEQILDKMSSLVEGELRRVFPSLIENSLKYHKFIGDVYQILEDFILRRGKRLASATTLMAYTGYNKNIDKEILRVGCGIELIRHSILIHDDIVDSEETRRGEKTIHKLLESKYDDRFGWGTSIFAGNMLFSLGLILILDSSIKINKNKLLEVSDLILSNFKGVNESQILDLLFEYKNPDVQEWNSMADRRAVTLFRASILTGAILSGAPEKDVKLLNNAAINIGYAFDIQDDIIDTFSSEDSYGRKPCYDISKGKRPLHIILTINKDAKAANLIKTLKGKELTEQDIENLRKVIRETGALKEAKKRSELHSQKAKEFIEKTTMNNKSKKFFIDITDYIKENLNWYE